MSKEETGLGEETHGVRAVPLSCPYCEHGILGHSSKGDYLVCGGCRRKVEEVRVTAPRLRLLLDALDNLYNYSDDKELRMHAHYAGSEIHRELEARGVNWSTDEEASGLERVPDLAIPGGWLKICGLSGTAIAALNELRQEYEFGDGPDFLENVLQVLCNLRKRNAAQGRLYRQLRVIPFETREALSRSLVPEPAGPEVVQDIANRQTT